MSATLESRTLIASARRLRVLKAAHEGMEIEVIETVDGAVGGASGGFAHHAAPRSGLLKNGAYVMKTRYLLRLASMYARKSALICVW